MSTRQSIVNPPVAHCDQTTPPRVPLMPVPPKGLHKRKLERSSHKVLKEQSAKKRRKACKGWRSKSDGGLHALQKGLSLMVQGLSANKASKSAGVCRKALKSAFEKYVERTYKKYIRCPHNKCTPSERQKRFADLSSHQKSKLLDKVKDAKLARRGNPNFESNLDEDHSVYVANWVALLVVQLSTTTRRTCVATAHRMLEPCLLGRHSTVCSETQVRRVVVVVVLRTGFPHAARGEVGVRRPASQHLWSSSHNCDVRLASERL
jgi:hypothetical protein